MKNLKEFKALIKRYESITLKEIESISLGSSKNIYFKRAIRVAEALTGFGDKNKCSLCIAIAEDCTICVWASGIFYKRGYRLPCADKNNAVTFDNFWNAKTNEDLLKAFKARAKRMKAVLKNLKVGANENNS